MAKVTEWPLWILAAAALGALFGLLQLHPAHVTHVTRDMRIVYDARLAAVALAFGIIMLLATGPAQRRMAERRKDREAKREARRATYIQHADPVIATVGRHEQVLGDLAAGQQSTERKVDTLLATFADVLGEHGDAQASLSRTQPLPLYLAAKDGEIISKDKERDAS